MLPALAAHAISVYTSPGDLVLDPMCGVGTTLVEAVHLGRDAIGLDLEPRFTAIAAANLDLATGQGATGHGRVLTGDATRLAARLPGAAVGKVALVLTSPPYGPITHGLVSTSPDGVAKHHHRYGRAGRGNLAYTGWDRLFAGFAEIMTACRQVMRPGGFVVITARPVRRQRDDLVDLPGRLQAIAQSAGFEPVERCVALLAAVRDEQIVHRASMFAILAARRSRTDGIPVSVIAHEDVIVLKRPCRPGL
jgi:DNA modification methylase